MEPSSTSDEQVGVASPGPTQQLHVDNKPGGTAAGSPQTTAQGSGLQGGSDTSDKAQPATRQPVVQQTAPSQTEQPASDSAPLSHPVAQGGTTSADKVVPSAARQVASAGLKVASDGNAGREVVSHGATTHASNLGRAMRTSNKAETRSRAAARLAGDSRFAKAAKPVGKYAGRIAPGLDFAGGVAGGKSVPQAARHTAVASAGGALGEGVGDIICAGATLSTDGVGVLFCPTVTAATTTLGSAFGGALSDALGERRRSASTSMPRRTNSRQQPPPTANTKPDVYWVYHLR